MDHDESEPLMHFSEPILVQWLLLFSSELTSHFKTMLFGILWDYVFFSYLLERNAEQCVFVDWYSLLNFRISFNTTVVFFLCYVFLHYVTCFLDCMHIVQWSHGATVYSVRVYVCFCPQKTLSFE